MNVFHAGLSITLMKLVNVWYWEILTVIS